MFNFLNEQKDEKGGFQSRVGRASFYCTFTALVRKCLIMRGAGEGNRTLVSIPSREWKNPTGVK